MWFLVNSKRDSGGFFGILGDSLGFMGILEGFWESTEILVDSRGILGNSREYQDILGQLKQFIVTSRVS